MADSESKTLLGNSLSVHHILHSLFADKHMVHSIMSLIKIGNKLIMYVSRSELAEYLSFMD